MSSCNGVVMVPATHAVHKNNRSVGAVDQAQPSTDPSVSRKVVQNTHSAQTCIAHRSHAVVRCYLCDAHIKSIGMCVQGLVVCCPCYENKIVPLSLSAPPLPSHTSQGRPGVHNTSAARGRGNNAVDAGGVGVGKLASTLIDVSTIPRSPAATQSIIQTDALNVLNDVHDVKYQLPHVVNVNANVMCNAVTLTHKHNHPIALPLTINDSFSTHALIDPGCTSSALIRASAFKNITPTPVLYPMSNGSRVVCSNGSPLPITHRFVAHLTTASRSLQSIVMHVVEANENGDICCDVILGLPFNAALKQQCMNFSELYLFDKDDESDRIQCVPGMFFVDKATQRQQLCAATTGTHNGSHVHAITHNHVPPSPEKRPLTSCMHMHDSTNTSTQKRNVTFNAPASPPQSHRQRMEARHAKRLDAHDVAMNERECLKAVLHDHIFNNNNYSPPFQRYIYEYMCQHIHQYALTPHKSYTCTSCNSIINIDTVPEVQICTHCNALRERDVEALMMNDVTSDHTYRLIACKFISMLSHLRTCHRKKRMHSSHRWYTCLCSRVPMKPMMTQIRL